MIYTVSIDFTAFWITVDDSIDIIDIAQFSVFERGVTDEFEDIEELWKIILMKGKTGAQDIFFWNKNC